MTRAMGSMRAMQRRVEAGGASWTKRAAPSRAELSEPIPPSAEKPQGRTGVAECAGAGCVARHEPPSGSAAGGAPRAKETTTPVNVEAGQADEVAPRGISATWRGSAEGDKTSREASG